MPLRSKRLIVAAVAVAALAGAGIAIAAGFGAFNESNPFHGISAAQHPPTAADKLDPAVAATFAEDLRRDAGIVRFVSQLGDGVRIYAVATAGGGLCSIAERLPGPHRVKGKPTEIACGQQLTRNSCPGNSRSGRPLPWPYSRAQGLPSPLALARLTG